VLKYGTKCLRISKYNRSAWNCDVYSGYFRLNFVIH
jgi:hypothetical protein